MTAWWTINRENADLVLVLTIGGLIAVAIEWAWRKWHG